METTQWQRQDVTKHYLEQVRGGIPFGAEQIQVMLQVIQHFTPNVQKIMDLGCGNGFLGKVLLDTYPAAQALFIDHSEPMVEQAKEYLAAYQHQSTVVQGDFSESLSAFTEPNSVDCIVSGFAIHHLPHDKKKKLYAEIYTLLKDGGIFINVEHTASATTKLENLYDEQFVQHLANYNERSIEEVAKEYYSRPDKEDNILERVDIQVNWLRELGYQHADCYFKWFELAVFGGVK
ncbi:class I SAM-dependent methyltransferase [Solibacillus sp. FSL R7-0668]|uniref:class I SAM-dependent methyltransferase n=1 Tax=Solibacillus sp. FSL R7-0668 TaxID=2921688 RepID=UPI0030FBC5E7